MYKNKPKKISIVIPCFNEQEGIKYVLSQVPSFVDEKLVVDNNSQDRTAEIARKSGAKVVFERKQGYGVAYKKGFKEASGEIIVTMDGDGSYDLKDLKENLKLMEAKNLDFISCARRLKKESNLDGFLRRLGNLILNSAIFILYGKKIKDSQSGMWIFKKKILKDLNLTDDGMAFSEEIKIEAFSNKNLKTTEVNTDYHTRIGKSKLKVWRDGLKNLTFLIQKRFSLGKKDLILLFLISAGCFLIMLPSIFLPWSLIDDGDILQTSRKILFNISHFNINGLFSIIWESSIGRFRPVYWLYNSFAYLIGGKNPLPYHVFRLINFWIISLLGFLTCKEIKGRRAGLLFFLFFAFSYLPFENWYRLGPQEPLSLLLLSFSFYLIVTKRFSLSFWPILLSFFVKETNIVFALYVLFLFLYNRIYKIIDSRQLRGLILKLLVSSLIVGGLMFLMKAGGTYSANYQANRAIIFKSIKDYLSFFQTYLGYFPLLAIAALVFLKKRKEEFFWTSNVLIISIILFLVILPWPFSLGRYLLPSLFFFSVFLGIELDKLLNFFNKNLLVKLGLLYYFIGILIQNGVTMSGTFYDYFQREKIDEEFVSYIASSVKPKSTIYFNIVGSAKEFIEESKMHLDLFYSRKDVNLDFLEKNTGPKENDYLVESYIKSNLDSLPGNTVEVKKIKRVFKTLIVTTPVGFTKRMIVWGMGIVRGNYKIPDGIYTFYQGNYYWNIFQIKSSPGQESQ